MFKLHLAQLQKLKDMNYLSRFNTNLFDAALIILII